MKINVLGTEYKLYISTEEKEPRLKNSWGVTDVYAKEIIISNDCDRGTEYDCKNLKLFKNKVIRHEIIHAFLYESGMKENSSATQSWVENEEMVDWFAIQLPKIYKVYKELDILEGKNNEEN
jgi:hypothetical protein